MSKSIAFVTGATGFLGSHIARQLIEDENMTVRVLARQSAKMDALEGVPVEIIHGDLENQAALEKGMEGAKWVFHVAASVVMWRRQWTQSHRVNVLGTRNMVQAALNTGVSKFIHTSTGSTLGKSKDGESGVVDETCTYDMEAEGLVYPHNKWLAEQEVKEGIKNGLFAVITQPAMIFGPGDVNVNIGRYLIEAKKGMARVATQGFHTVCDVRDVAHGHILAAKKGKKGEHYILAGESMSNFDMLTKIAAQVGAPGPMLKIPDSVLLGLGQVLDAVADLTGKPPFLSSDMTKEAVKGKGKASSAKAERELGYSCRPFEESLRDTYEWYKDKGYF